MGTGAKPARSQEAAQPLPCVARFPKTRLAGVKAKLACLHRRGAVICVALSDLRGDLIDAQDPVLLEVSLPTNRTFGRRVMHCVGKATHISESTEGKLWLTVRFQQLCFQPVEPGSQDEVDSVLFDEDDRGQSAADNDNRAGDGSLII